MTMAWRATMKMRRNPEQFFDVIVQPLLVTAMFAYIFGGAISGDVASYLPLLIPGILAQTTLTACIATGTQLREDMDKGVFERFKALPIARIAPLAGPMVADLLRYTIATVLTFATGFAMGYRPAGGVFGVLAAALPDDRDRLALAWIFTFVGIKGKSAQAVQGMSMMIMFPLTFLSNAFVPEDTMPGWLQAFVQLNPVSHVGLGGARPRQQGRRDRRRSAGQCSHVSPWSRCSRRCRCGRTGGRCRGRFALGVRASGPVSSSRARLSGAWT
jgi:ABC-2 type transport system permease protein